MAIDKQTEADILRLHFAEKWRVGTIATHLSLHHSTIDRVISQAGCPKVERSCSPSILDPYLPFITETLNQYPTLTAARLYAMVQERGYPGGPSHFRQRIAQMRPRPQPEAYLRLKTLPGEEGQVDWGSFGHVEIGKARRPLVAFVMVLSWSRRIFLRFYTNQQMSAFLHGHVSAFEQWGCVPRVLLYDNLKSAVLERRGQAIRFHPTLLELSAHYRFEPRPVAVARGNEKGRVERAIRYVRDSFFAGRTFTDVVDLNVQAQQWCQNIAHQRSCPGDPDLTVEQAFMQEQSQMLSLPTTPFPSEDRVEARSGKTPYIRYDLNDYSIPFELVRKPLTVVASEDTVRILDGDEEIAQHARSYSKREQIENPQHVEALRQWKREASCHNGQDRLAAAIPASSRFIEAALQRGERIASVVKQLLSCLDDYGAQELSLAIEEVMTRGVAHPNAVRQVLQRRREDRQQPPPLCIQITNPRGTNTTVKTHSLSSYDQLTQSATNDYESTSLDREETKP